MDVSWDCFCYCLETYKNLEVPLPSHFSRNTEYFVLKCLERKNKLKLRKKNIEIPIEENVEYGLNESISSTNIISGNASLSLFRNSLEENYRQILDDVLTGNKTRVVENPGTNKYLSTYRYNEAKKVFKMIIHFFLMGGE